VRDDLALVEDLAAPDAHRLVALDCTGQTSQLSGATPTQRFRMFEVARSIGEPQVGIMNLAGQVVAETRAVGNRQPGMVSTRSAARGTVGPARQEPGRLGIETAGLRQPAGPVGDGVHG